MKHKTYRRAGGVQCQDSHAAEELAYQSEKGCGYLFGIPFMLAGLVALAFAALALFGSQQTGVGMLASSGIAALVGLVFTLVGAAIAFLHSGISFNRKTRTIYKWWRLLGINSNESHRFEDFDRLRFWREETRDSDGDTQISFPVKLHFIAGKELSVSSFSKEDGARAMAEEIGKFCGFPVENAVGAQPVVRQPAELDENLRQRALRKGVPALTAPPPQMQSRFEASGNRVRVEIHAPRRSLLSLLPVAACVVFAAVVTIFLLLPGVNAGQTSLGYPLFIGTCFIVAPIVVTLWAFFAQRGRACTISADKHALRVEFAGKPADEIPAGELEELSVEQSTERQAQWLGQQFSIVARSDTKTVRFGRGLGQDELQWLCVLLERAIVSEL